MNPFLRFMFLLLFPAVLFSQTDVTLGYGASSGGSWSGGNPDVWTSTTWNAKLNVGEIESRLNAGTSVTITTTDGSITDSIGVVIRKTAGGDATLKFAAYGPSAYRSYIYFNQNDTIISTSGKLHLIFNADADGNGDGYIMGRVYNNGNTSAGIYFASNGGDIIYGGGTDPATTPAYGYPGGMSGVWLNGVKNIASGGAVSIRGVGTSGWAGVQLAYGTTAQTTTADVTIHGVGPSGSSAEYGVRIGSDSSIIETTDGNITITGTGGSGTSYGYGGFLMSGASRIRTVDGDISITGTGGSSTYGYCNGIQISGYYTEDPIIQTVNGTITLNGTAGSSTSGDAYGITMADGGGIWASGTGSIAITAIGGVTSYYGNGLKLSAGQSTAGYIHTNSGPITITATGGATTTAGSSGLYLYSNGTNAYINSTTGTISIHSRSTSGGDALFMQGDNTSIESGGDISILADRTGTGTAGHGITMSFNPKIKAFGTANITINATGSSVGTSSCGLQMYSGSPLISSEQGSILITATGGGASGNGNHGIDMGSGASIYAAGSGDVRITSTAGFSGYGLNLAGNTRIQTDSGSMVITGTGTGATFGYGYNRNGSGYGLINNYGDSLSLTFIGSGTEPAMAGYGGSTIGSATFPGTLIIRASSLGSDHISLSPFTVSGAGTLTLAPSAASTTIGLGSGAGTYNLSSSDLGAIANGFHRIVIGRADGSGTMTINGASFSDSLELLTGTGSITMSGSLSNSGNSIDITTDGTVIQTTSLTSARLTLSGNGTFLIHPTVSVLTKNSGSLTLNGATQVTDTLFLGSTYVYMNSNTLTIGADADHPGVLDRTTGMFAGGSLKRWFAADTVSNILFPVVEDGDVRFANVTFTAAPSSGGTVTATFSASAPGTNGFPFNDGAALLAYPESFGYWTLSAGNGLSGGTYDVSFDAGDVTFPNIANLHLVKRSNSSSDWSAAGTHSAATTESGPVTRLGRTGLTSFSDFAFGSTVGDSPYLEYSATSWSESNANNGRMDNSTPMIITLNGPETFTGTDNDDFVATGKITVGNLPSGLTAVIRRVSATSLSMTLTGLATAHEAADSVNTVTLTFQNSAFTGNDANGVIFSAKSGLRLLFQDAYTPHVLLFDGVNDRLIAAAAAGNFGTGDFTVEAWIKTSASSLGVIAAKRFGNSHENFSVFAVDANGKLLMALDEDFAGTNYYGGISNAAVNDGTWHHVAFTRTGTTVSFYIDGVLDKQETADGPANLVNGTALSIGAVYDNSLNGGAFTGFFHGSMEDLRIWDRAKTQTQIADSMVIELRGTEYGLRAYYTFNAGTGLTAHDMSANGYDATLIDGAAWDVQTFGQIAYSDTVFTESTDTPGTINNTVPKVITLSGMEAFTGSNGENFVTAGKVTVTNLPAGLTAVITRTSSRTLSVTLTGTAVSHQQIHDIANLTFVFQNSAFAGNNAAATQGYSRSNLAIRYKAPLVMRRSNGVVVFSKTGSNDPSLPQYQDRITDNVWITRGNSGGGLYNAKNESGWNFGDYHATPSGTEWAFGTTDNYASLSYGTWFSMTGWSPPSLVGQNMVLHLIADDIYVDVKFLSWPGGVPGEFSYERAIVFTEPTLLYDDTVFVEASSNNGAIDNTTPVSITLLNDTFTQTNGTDFVAAGLVTVSNLPAGLTMVATRTSATTMSLTLTGTATVHSSANSVTDLTLTFLDAAFASDSAESVAFHHKATLVVSFLNSSLSYQRSSFFESATIAGAIDNSSPMTVTLAGETFTGAISDDLVAAGKVTVTNLPAGLSAVATKTSAATVEITLTGTAASHAAANFVPDLTVSFTNAAFSGNDASVVTNSTKSDLRILYDIGMAGSALRFDGSDDFISLPNGVYFNGNFTVEAWVYEYSYANWSRLIDFGNGPGSDNIVIPISTGTSGQVSLHVFQGGSSQSIQAPTSIPLEQWTHIACVLNNGTATIYYNGIAVATGAVHAPLNIIRTSNFIGKSNWADALANMVADEIRFWNVARTEQQIREEMYRTVEPTTPGLTGYWQFNDQNGTTALATVGPNGTLNNFNNTVSSGPVVSSAPAAYGVSTSAASVQSGSAALGDMTLSITEPFDAAADVTASVLRTAPFNLPAGYASAVQGRYFIIQPFADQGTFTADLMLNFGAGNLDSRVDSYPAGIRLFRRASTGIGSWTEVGGAVAASSTTGAATWSGISTLGQFVAVYEESALPVELTSFTAAAQRLNAELRWSTATEVNNNGFRLQRKKADTSAAAAWTDVAFVAGNGTINAAHEYTYTDRHQKAGRYRYRLQQIDNDGRSGFSQEVEVTVGAAPLVFGLSQNYPNPFNPATTIEFTVPATARATLKVYNLVGQEVATVFDGIAEAGTYHTAQFNASHLASGFYLARLVSGNSMQVRKMVLMK
ncbi:MAG: T9SS type A sorting domain-containing protein [Bacteroidetes bacterium]|nr:T9SS type A sorting domain-containing protein [Bacteroidota bacterium]